MMSTGGSSAPRSLVMSPTWIMPGKRSFVTSMGNASISDAHTGVMPLRTAAKGNPPIPSNRLPMVICVNQVISSPFHLIAAAMVRVVLTAACAVYTALVILAFVVVSKPKLPAMRGTSPAESMSPTPMSA